MERIAVVLGLTFTLMSASILTLPSVNPEGHGAYPPPSNGDWIVTNDTFVGNETIVLNGNLIVEDGGSLTLMNVTLKVNCDENGSYHLEVKDGGGMFIMNHSNITSNNPDGCHRFNFWVREGAVFEMGDSELHECGYFIEYEIFETKGLYIESDYCQISNSFFSDNMDGITVNNSCFIEIENCIFSNNTVGIDFNNAQFNQVINCNFIENGLGIYSFFTHNNSIIDCEFSGDSFAIHFTGYNATLINNSFRNNKYGIYVLLPGSTLRDNSFVNITNDIFLAEYVPEYELYYDVDTSNTIDGMPIYCIINQKDMEISPNSGYDKVGYLAVINSENITIQDFSLNENTYGLQLLNVSHSNVNNISVNNNVRGIGVVGSSHNSIRNCIIENNSNGIIIWDVSNNNTLCNNRIANNDKGIWVIRSSNNTLYYNTFISNDPHIYGSGQNQQWDDGKTGGNFWEDYNGLDDGSNNRTAGDGIGDTDVPHLGLDNYPFMEIEVWLSNVSWDADSDGIWDLRDSDDDNDGYNDTTELAEGTDPQDSASIPSDYDKDFIPDSTDPDIDNDGFPNEVDDYPFDENKWREDDDSPINVYIGFIVFIMFIIFVLVLLLKKKNIG